jgi:hypothetical protein
MKAEREKTQRQHQQIDTLRQINSLQAEVRQDSRPSTSYSIDVLTGRVAGLPLGAGHTAIVRGLMSRDELNGTVVKLLHYVEEQDRWAVECDSGERLLLRPAKLYRGIQASVSQEQQIEQALDAAQDEAKAKSLVPLPDKLSQAAARGNLTAVIKYLRKGDVNAQCVAKMNRTLLHEAVTFNNPSITELLLSRRADPNIASVFGSTPLHQAAAAGSEDICRQLLAAGADVHRRTSDGKSIAHLPRAAGHTGVLRLLVDAGLQDAR